MNNLWPKEFKTKTITPAKQILEEQAKMLPKLTGDKVFARITSMTAFDAMDLHDSHDFKFSFLLLGKFLHRYSFKVFNFSYDISLYPLKITPDELISKELGLDSSVVVNDETGFTVLLNQIFNSDRIKDIIGSIMTISPEQEE